MERERYRECGERDSVCGEREGERERGERERERERER